MTFHCRASPGAGHTGPSVQGAVATINNKRARGILHERPERPPRRDDPSGGPVEPAVDAALDRVHALPAMQAWTADALAEHDFIDFDEPYRAR